MNDRVACSMLAASQPLAGTAPEARAWLVVEHPVPWGRDALTDSGLPAAVVDHIREAQQEAPVRFLAARGNDAGRRRRPHDGPRRVWLAHCRPDGGLARQTTVQRLEELLDLDLLALAEGNVPDAGSAVTDPVEFVCTHSTRDACCAIHGRRRVDTAAGRVWECSHLGGHRFAATSLFLPSGRLYGRLGAWVGPAEPPASFLRGPSYLSAPLQAAECAVRLQRHMSADRVLHVHEVEDRGGLVTALITCSTGAEWTVVSESATITTAVSCGAEATHHQIWRARIVDERI